MQEQETGVSEYRISFLQSLSGSSILRQTICKSLRYHHGFSNQDLACLCDLSSVETSHTDVGTVEYCTHPHTHSDLNASLWEDCCGRGRVSDGYWSF